MTLVNNCVPDFTIHVYILLKLQRWFHRTYRCDSPVNAHCANRIGVIPIANIAMRNKNGSFMENIALSKLWAAPERIPVKPIVVIPHSLEKNRTFR